MRTLKSPWSELWPMRSKRWNGARQIGPVSFLLPITSSGMRRTCLRTSDKTSAEAGRHIRSICSQLVKLVDTVATNHRAFLPLLPASFFFVLTLTDLNFHLPNKASTVYLCLRLRFLRSLGDCQFKKYESWEQAKGCPIIMSICDTHGMFGAQNAFPFCLS